MEINQKCNGPILPPLFNNKNISKSSETNIHQNKILGPQLPPHMQSIAYDSPTLDNNNYDVIGPFPLTDATDVTGVETKLSTRALQIKIKNIEGATNTKLSDVSREEWMLELPEIHKNKNVLSLPRSFQTKEQPDFSDRSSWTDIPNNNNKKLKNEDIYKKKLDAEIEKNRELIAQKFKKKKKDDKSLFKLHQEELKKKSSKKKCEAQRRPFNREFDLQSRSFNNTKKNAFVKNAQLPDTKFSFGTTKYL